MTAPNPNWHRWTFASVCKHVVDELESSFPVFIEGSQRITSADTEQKFELRIDGPTFTEVSKRVSLG